MLDDNFWMQLFAGRTAGFPYPELVNKNTLVPQISRKLIMTATGGLLQFLQKCLLALATEPTIRFAN